MGWLIFIGVMISISSFAVGYELGYSRALKVGRFVIEKT